MDEDTLFTRRRLLELGVAAPLPLVLAGGALGARAPATPACDDGDDETPPQTEGPYYTLSSPRRRSLLEPELPGTRLAVTGRVLTTRCRPVRGALLDFWQADAGGVYDNEGYRLRGHQLTDGRGRYRLETVVPGLYSGRTRHIHVKVQAPGGPVLTTQLYFANEPRNRTDGIFDPDLVMTVRRAGTWRSARFDFVVET
jgi:protocatechuate 3,4-dioxygenase beta subunit